MEVISDRKDGKKMTIEEKFQQILKGGGKRENRWAKQTDGEATQQPKSCKIKKKDERRRRITLDHYYEPSTQRSIDQSVRERSLVSNGKFVVDKSKSPLKLAGQSGEMQMADTTLSLNPSKRKIKGNKMIRARNAESGHKQQLSFRSQQVNRVNESISKGNCQTSRRVIYSREKMKIDFDDRMFKTNPAQRSESSKVVILECIEMGEVRNLHETRKPAQAGGRKTKEAQREYSHQPKSRPELPPKIRKKTKKSSKKTRSKRAKAANEKKTRDKREAPGAARVYHSRQVSQAKNNLQTILQSSHKVKSISLNPSKARLAIRTETPVREKSKRGTGTGKATGMAIGRIVEEESKACLRRDESGEPSGVRVKAKANGSVRQNAQKKQMLRVQQIPKPDNNLRKPKRAEEPKSRVRNAENTDSRNRIHRIYQPKRKGNLTRINKKFVKNWDNKAKGMRRKNSTKIKLEKYKSINVEQLSQPTRGEWPGIPGNAFKTQPYVRDWDVQGKMGRAGGKNGDIGTPETKESLASDSRTDNDKIVRIYNTRMRTPEKIENGHFLKRSYQQRVQRTGKSRRMRSNMSDFSSANFDNNKHQQSRNGLNGQKKEDRGDFWNEIRNANLGQIVREGRSTRVKNSNLKRLFSGNFRHLVEPRKSPILTYTRKKRI